MAGENRCRAEMIADGKDEVDYETSVFLGDLDVQWRSCIYLPSPEARQASGSYQVIAGLFPPSDKANMHVMMIGTKND